MNDELLPVFHHIPAVTRIPHGSNLPGDLLDYLYEQRHFALNTTLRSYGVDVTDPCPQAPRTDVLDSVHEMFCNGDEFNRRAISRDDCYRVNYVGECSHVTFPYAYAYVLLDLHQTKQVCGALAALANLIVTAPTPEPKAEINLVKLYKKCYQFPCPALQRYAKIEAVMRRVFGKRVSSAYCEETDDETSGNLTSFLVHGAAESVFGDLLKNFPNFRFRVVPYKAFSHSIYPTFYDEFGNVLPSGHYYIDSELQDEIRRVYKLRKLQLLSA